MKIREIINVFKIGSTENPGMPLYTDNSFTFSFKNSEESFYWHEIKKLIAYKADVIATDCVCLYIELENERRFEINEELYGWDGFVTAMNTALKLDESWFWEVVQPPLAINETVLYQK